ncbi:MAG TPA: hypothetical protein VGX28_02635 [Frankiaceae bacterium]|jgi:hypothetical protein|nr:hypothetical protein [Frankiaceae bacterium]
MTKRFAGLALAGAAALTFVLPATSASASCQFTEPLAECVKDLVSTVGPAVGCVPVGTFELCPVSA